MPMPLSFTKMKVFTILHWCSVSQLQWDYIFFALFSDFHAMMNMSAGGRRKIQRNRKPISQLPFKMIHAILRMIIVAMANIPPANSQRQAINKPSRVNPSRLSKNLSTAAMGPDELESGMNIHRAKATTRALQMRAIQRIVFTDRGAV